MTMGTERPGTGRRAATRAGRLAVALAALGLMLAVGAPRTAQARDPSTNMYMGATIEHGYHKDLKAKRGLMTYTYLINLVDSNGGFATTMDLVLGGGAGGFVYDMNFLFGAGTPPDEVLGYGLTAGFGLGGITGGHLPFAFTLPVQAYVQLNLGDTTHIMAYVRPYWVALAPERDKGTETFGSFDELRAGIILGTAEIERGGADPDEWGGFIGLTYREARGNRMLGLFVGFGTAQGD